MTRYFGIAGIQMAVEPWNANATVDKMRDAVLQVSRSFPWVNLCIFHELAVPGLVQFMPTERPDTWRQDAQPIPVKDQDLPGRTDVDAVHAGEVAIHSKAHRQAAIRLKHIDGQGLGQHKGGKLLRRKALQQFPDTPGPVRKAPKDHQARPLAGIRGTGARHPYSRHRVLQVAECKKLSRDGMPKRRGFPWHRSGAHSNGLARPLRNPPGRSIMKHQPNPEMPT